VNEILIVDILDGSGDVAHDLPCIIDTLPRPIRNVRVYYSVPETFGVVTLNVFKQTAAA
jgi:hypothetical protein